MEKVRGKHKKRERRKDERGDKINRRRKRRKNILKTKEEIKKVK